jgi:hypothetical protein
MVYILHLTNAIIVYSSLIISSYAIPSHSKLGSSSSVADRLIVSSSSMILDNLNDSRSGPIYSNSTEVLNTSLGPEWPISCSVHLLPVSITDCYYIATQIENSPGATSNRIYTSDEPFLDWTHGNCRAIVSCRVAGATHATDVFKPVLIARDIRRVVERCGITIPRQSGMTAVGPRGKFRLHVQEPTL